MDEETEVGVKVSHDVSNLARPPLRELVDWVLWVDHTDVTRSVSKVT